ncbi:MAG: peptidoglycan-binding protein [Acidimicrobiales bacterium]
MIRRALIGIAVVAVLAAGGAVAMAAAGGSASSDEDGGSGSSTPTATAEVTRRDLAEQAELDGTLGYGETRELSFAGQGTITALAAEGSIVERGGVLGELDGRPIPLLYGDRPLWRSLGAGVDDGPDIRVLEENLIALGFATERQLGPNERWSQATTAAVERWQEAMGMEETGTVEPSQVVVASGAVRIASHKATVGGGGGGPVFDVSGTERLVTVDLAASRQGLLSVDQAVDVELPDGSRTAGRVRSISNVVEAPADQQSGGEPTVEVVIALDDPAAAGTLDQAPVDVHVTTAAAVGVLAVPVEALLALAEGGYAVERVGADGTTELVGVGLGAFADGFVEVTGTTADLAEGDQVVVPE